MRLAWDSQITFIFYELSSIGDKKYDFQLPSEPICINIISAIKVLSSDPECFKSLVQESLRRQVKAISTLCAHEVYFWDYGNAFLLEARRSGADVGVQGQETDETVFRYPSYVQDIMGFVPVKLLVNSLLSFS